MPKVVEFAKAGAPGPKLMKGSTDGHYFPFARQGDVLLGIRPSGVFSGSRFGMPKTTYFACRLRSAPSNGLFAEEDGKKKVVKLVKQPDNLWDAWPKVTWEKQDDSRASTTVGAFIQGEFISTDESQQKLLLSEIDDGKLSQKLADYLTELAGEENMIVLKRDLKGWLDGQFNPMIESILEQIEKKKAMTQAMSANVGNFGMQAALLKKVFEESKKHKKPKHHAGDDDAEAEAEIAEIEGEQE